MLDRIVIVGAGRTAESLVPRLSLIAPVVVIDSSERALGEIAPSSGPQPDAGPALTPLPVPAIEPASSPRMPVTKIAADGSSRLVLEDVRGPASSQTALVAATGEDRTNLEICRLAHELDFRPVIGIAIDPATAPKYDALGTRPIVRATLLGDVVERALRYDGIAVASTVGLGKGDVIEVRVLPTSPFVGQSLASLHPDRWRVAAIYRKSALVIPTGATTVEPDDRVLLVGDPEVLPRIAEELRLGAPDFPLRFGPNVVAFLPDGPDPLVEHEAEVLEESTRARALVRVEGAPREPFAAKVAKIAAARPGLVVASFRRRTLGDRILGRGGQSSVICDTVGVPIVFAGGEPTIRRVVFVVAESLPRLRVADVAIDIARMRGVPLAIVQVDLPAYLGGAEAEVAKQAAGVARRAQLHRVAPATLRVRGNPIHEVTEITKPDDLVVVTRTRHQRDSFTTPDVALRISAASCCATLVITGEKQ